MKLHPITNQYRYYLYNATKKNSSLVKTKNCKNSKWNFPERKKIRDNYIFSYQQFFSLCDQNFKMLANKI